MLAGGGPVITTDTGGIPEAVGDTALIVPVEDPAAIAAALDRALGMGGDERSERADAAREYALQFDRAVVLDKILDAVAEVVPSPAA
jgi:glycosyltransferase involved in cell wall biosynthesis